MPDPGWAPLRCPRSSPSYTSMRERRAEYALVTSAVRSARVRSGRACAVEGRSARDGVREGSTSVPTRRLGGAIGPVHRADRRDRSGRRVRRPRARQRLPARRPPPATRGLRECDRIGGGRVWPRRDALASDRVRRDPTGTSVPVPAGHQRVRHVRRREPCRAMPAATTTRAATRSTATSSPSDLLPRPRRRAGRPSRPSKRCSWRPWARSRPTRSAAARSSSRPRSEGRPEVQRDRAGRAVEDPLGRDRRQQRQGCRLERRSPARPHGDLRRGGHGRRVRRLQRLQRAVHERRRRRSRSGRSRRPGRRAPPRPASTTRRCSSLLRCRPPRSTRSPARSSSFATTEARFRCHSGSSAGGG